MHQNKSTAFNFIFKDETHFIDNQETRFGLTVNQLKVLTGKAETKPSDLAKLERSQAVDLLDKHYWTHMYCHHLPNGIDYFIFDSGLVHGQPLAIRWLQFATELPPYGVLSVKDCKYIGTIDPIDLLEKLERYRRAYIRNHPEWFTYGNVWSNRVTRVRTRAKKLIAGTA